ncbi:MAG: beta-glucanase (GH16 family) [Psychromonas sp.]|jgi:beta-glucanase (GH16 family)|uniref:glycoside hydrolase family 16 protein n=1 Tax=Psychromonas sp. TaxID=1884585 RepID=UPI0039E596E3
MKSTLKKSQYFIVQNAKARRTKLAGSLTALVMLSLSAPSMAGWEVQWIDKFEGTEVNWENWTAQTQANYNNEVQCYTDDDSSANKNYDVSNGTLKIIARKQNIACPGLGGTQKSWTSGRLNSKDKSEFLYGRIESRIRFDTLEGGTWPAFWMLENRIGQQPVAYDGDDVSWPYAGAGEIDVWEWFSNTPDTYITNFFNETGRNMPENNGCGSVVLHDYPNGGADVQNWHNYAMEWTKDQITFYIDDTLVVTQDMSICSQYQEPMFVLLNVAMGGNLGGYINPSLTQATMEVDYVAHCAASSASNATNCGESTPSVLGNDSDADGVDDDVDFCPNTAADTEVNASGCSTEQITDNIPRVIISIQQNGQTVSEINPENGIVTITALTSSTNEFNFNWGIDSLPSPIENGFTVTFDPTSMSDNTYVVAAVISDSSDSTLSSSDHLSFTVKAATLPVDVSQVESKSGGSMGNMFLLCLVLLGLFRRQKRC